MTECDICGKRMQNASIQRHMLIQHQQSTSKYCKTITTNTAPTVYRLPHVIKGQFNHCPIPGCTGGGKDCFTVYRHFCYRHTDDEIVIDKEGWLPKCDLCGMRTQNITQHQRSTTCRAARRRREHERK